MKINIIALRLISITIIIAFFSNNDPLIAQKDYSYEVKYKSTRIANGDSVEYHMIYDYPMCVNVCIYKNELFSKEILNVESNELICVYYAIESDDVYYCVVDQNDLGIFKYLNNTSEDSIYYIKKELENKVVADETCQGFLLESNSILDFSQKIYYTSNYHYKHIENDIDSFTSSSLVTLSLPSSKQEKSEIQEISSEILNQKWLQLDTTQLRRVNYSSLSAYGLLFPQSRTTDLVFDKEITEHQLYSFLVEGKPLVKTEKDNRINNLLEKAKIEGVLNEEYSMFKEMKIPIDIVGALALVKPDRMKDYLKLLSNEYNLSTDQRLVLDSTLIEHPNDLHALFKPIFNQVVLNDREYRKNIIQKLKDMKLESSDPAVTKEFLESGDSFQVLIESIKNNFKVEDKEEFKGLDEVTSYIDNIMRSILSKDQSYQSSVEAGENLILAMTINNKIYHLTLNDYFLIKHSRYDQLENKDIHQLKNYSFITDYSFIKDGLLTLANQISSDSDDSYIYVLVDWAELIQPMILDIMTIYKCKLEDVNENSVNLVTKDNNMGLTIRMDPIRFK